MSANEISGIIKILSVIMIIVGGLSCFYGFRIFRIIMAVLGFVIGGLLALIAGASTFVAILWGIVGALLLYFLYILAVFLTGAVLGLLLGIILAGLLQAFQAVLVFAILGFILGGIAAVILNKLIIILSTSFFGANWLVSGFLYLFLYNTRKIISQTMGVASIDYLAIALTLIVFVIGVLYQYGFFKGIKEGRSTDEMFREVRANIKSDYTNKTKISGYDELRPVGFGSPSFEGPSNFTNDYRKETPATSNDNYVTQDKPKPEPVSDYEIPQPQKVIDTPRQVQYSSPVSESNTSFTQMATIKVAKVVPQTLKFVPGYLEVIEGADKGRKFKVAGYPTADGNVISIGREEIRGERSYSHIQLLEKTVSRKQAEIIERKGSLYIKNLSETNFTQLNGNEIPVQEVFELNSGDRIKTGEVEFIYRA
ncbi:MAG TPA: DUF4203 domain-containing protein [Ignavibacteria bacterium]|nr:DUF4203 domain-containing protein [Ignavibacteria bacterium]